MVADYVGLLYMAKVLFSIIILGLTNRHATILRKPPEYGNG
jgi:hypothetical protein